LYDVMTRVPIDVGVVRFTEPLVRDARAIVQRHADRARIVLLGGIRNGQVR
jgi:hypothetical protein